RTGDPARSQVPTDPPGGPPAPGPAAGFATVPVRSAAGRPGRVGPGGLARCACRTTAVAMLRRGKGSGTEYTKPFSALPISPRDHLPNPPPLGRPVGRTEPTGVVAKPASGPSEPSRRRVGRLRRDPKPSPTPGIPARFPRWRTGPRPKSGHVL